MKLPFQSQKGRNMVIMWFSQRTGNISVHFSNKDTGMIHLTLGFYHFVCYISTGCNGWHKPAIRKKNEADICLDMCNGGVGTSSNQSIAGLFPSAAVSLGQGNRSHGNVLGKWQLSGFPNILPLLIEKTSTQQSFVTQSLTLTLYYIKI